MVEPDRDLEQAGRAVMAGSPKIDGKTAEQTPTRTHAFDEGGQAGATSDRPSLAGQGVAAVKSGAPARG